MYPRAPDDIMWHPSLQTEGFLDSEAPWETFQFMYMPIWSYRWLQVCGGEGSLPAQAEEG
jgi:hypothetical protein